MEELEDVDFEDVLEADSFSDDYEDGGADFYDFEDDQFLPALAALLPIAAKVAPAIMSLLGGLFEEESEEDDEDGLDGFDDDEDASYEMLESGDMFDADSDGEEFEDDSEDDFEDGEGDDLEAVFLTARAAKTKDPKLASVNAGALAAKATKTAPPKLKKKITKPLTKGSLAIVKTLRRSRSTKALMPVVAGTLKKTVQDLKKIARTGKPVKRKTVIKVLARNISRKLKSKSALKSVIKKHAFKRKILNKQAIKQSERFA